MEWYDVKEKQPEIGAKILGYDVFTDSVQTYIIVSENYYIGTSRKVKVNYGGIFYQTFDAALQKGEYKSKEVVSAYDCISIKTFFNKWAYFPKF